jgi:hypothetical protein
MYRNSPKEDYEFYVQKNSNGGYEVNLPHQCDNWKVLGFEVMDVKEYGSKHAIVDGVEVEGKYPAHPLNKEFAVSQMELFVKRAQEALEKLKAL